MAIDVSPEGLSFEIKRSLELQKTYLGESYWEAVRRFHGPAFRQVDRPSDTDFENHAHAWLSIFLPGLASGNPRCRGKTPRGGPAAAFAKAVELAVNRNAELTDVKRTIEQAATDWAFKYCILLTTPTPVKGMKEREDPPHRPTSKRLSLEDYIWDAVAKQHAECRLQAHRLRRDQDSLLEEASQFPERQWDIDAIMSLHKDKSREREQNRLSTNIQRGEVEFWEVWVPEVMIDQGVGANGNTFQPTEEEGFVGTIYTVNEDATKFLRAPRPFWGPRDGPYTFNGYLYVPDDVVPLAPLVATAAQMEILNRIMSAAIMACEKYKRGFAVSSSAPDLEKKIATFLDLGVFTVDDVQELDKSLKEVEAGGLTQQQLVMLEQLRFLADKSSGITEAQQGQISGDATATEASIASMSSGKRMGYMTEKFIQGVVKPIFEKEAWYLTMDPRSRIALGDLAEGMFVDPKTGQPIEYPVFQGGPEHGDLLEDLDIELQPISMRFTTEMLEAERAASWEQFLLSTAPIIPQLPYVDWGLVYARKAEQLGDPSLARTIDIQKAMAMGMIQMMSAMGPMAGAVTTQPTMAQPRLGVDMKRPQAMGPGKASEKPQGFTNNARPGGNGAAQTKKGPREAGTTAKAR